MRNNGNDGMMVVIPVIEFVLYPAKQPLVFNLTLKSFAGCIHVLVDLERRQFSAGAMCS